MGQESGVKKYSPAAFARDVKVSRCSKSTSFNSPSRGLGIRAGFTEFSHKNQCKRNRNQLRTINPNIFI